MRYDSIPDLTAQMRSHCPMGMGNDCACAARIEGRLEAGESEATVMADYTPNDGVLIIDITMELLTPPPSVEDIVAKVKRLRSLLEEPEATDFASSTSMAVALLSSDIMWDISHLRRAGIEIDESMFATEQTDGDVDTSSKASCDVKAFLANIAASADEDVPGSAGGNPDAAKVDETVLV